MLTKSQFIEAAAEAAVQSLACNSVLSAYKVQLDSFIDDKTPSKWIENSDGPRAEPCGTP